MSETTRFCARCGGQARPTEFGHVHVSLSSHPVFGPVPEDQIEPDEYFPPAIPLQIEEAAA